MLANDAPLPVLTPENKPFWTGGREGRLLIARCGQCRRRHHPPGPICPYCRGDDVGAEAVCGRATVASFTVNHQKWLPHLQTPYVIALVELEEDPGIRITTNLVNQPVEAARIGQAVQVVFEQHQDVWLPLFEPVEQSA